MQDVNNVVLMSGCTPCCVQALQLVSVTAVCQWQLVAVPMSAASYQDPLPQQYWVNSVKYAPSSYS